MSYPLDTLETNITSLNMNQLYVQIPECDMKLCKEVRQRFCENTEVCVYIKMARASLQMVRLCISV